MGMGVVGIGVKISQESNTTKWASLANYSPRRPPPVLVAVEAAEATAAQTMKILGSP